MGNCPNNMMKEILRNTLLQAIEELIQTSTILIEITK